MSSPDQPVPESDPEGTEVAQPPAAGDGDAGEASAVTPDQPVDEQPALDEEADDPADDVAVAEPVFDELRSPVLEQLTEKLGDAVVASEVVAGRDVWVRVRLDAWHEAGRVCRDELGMTYFCFLSAIDWLPSPFGKSEDDSAPAPVDPSAPLEHGVTGGETRFQLLARLENTSTGVGITLKADVPDDDLTVPSWVDLFAGAQWHEREAWEMFGIDFPGNPRKNEHLYLPGAFEGHPLRKDFPLLARMVKPWPGLVDVEPMPGEPDEENEAETEEASA